MIFVFGCVSNEFSVYIETWHLSNIKQSLKVLIVAKHGNYVEQVLFQRHISEISWTVTALTDYYPVIIRSVGRKYSIRIYSDEIFLKIVVNGIGEYICD